MGSMFPRHFGLQAFKAWKLFKTHQGTFGNDSLPRFFDGIVPHSSIQQPGGLLCQKVTAGKPRNGPMAGCRDTVEFFF